MRYRQHKRSLADSMETVVEFDGRHELLEHLRHELAPWPTAPAVTESTVHIRPYGDDKRIGWEDVHIVTLDGYGVMGFCEGRPV